MKQLYYRTLSFFNVIKSKIAFYPTVLAVFGVLFAFFMIYLENLGISKYLMDKAPVLVVNNGDTALTILSALISGLISVIVFSFSMVMLLLSQASSNYSPRLLPGLISNKNHQVILGTNLSTILYNIFILFTIQPNGDKYQIPGFSVLIGIIATVICIYAFIFFIHNISQSIQISNILEKIYIQSKNRLEILLEKETDSDQDFPESDDWHEYYSEKSGYFQNISTTNLTDICINEDTQIYILPVKGMFILKDTAIIKSKKKLDENVVKQILANFNFAREELVEDNYVLGFKQITEIIVKAMSPGINDPGTALNAIDYLTELFALRMKKKNINVIRRDDSPYLKVNTISFEELIYQVMASIRTYCKHDITLTHKLLLMFHYLINHKSYNGEYRDIVFKEVRRLLHDVKEGISNEEDVDKIMRLAAHYKLTQNN